MIMEGGEEEGVQDHDPDYHEQDLLQGGDHDHDLLDVGEGEEEGLQEREQRAKQRQIMKEIRAKKVRCDSPMKNC